MSEWIYMLSMFALFWCGPVLAVILCVSPWFLFQRWREREEWRYFLRRHQWVGVYAGVAALAGVSLFAVGTPPSVARADEAVQHLTYPPGTVWVNTDSGVYYYPGSRRFGRSIRGKFMSRTEAEAAGYVRSIEKLRRQDDTPDEEGRWTYFP
jgi:hypothetical protein